MIPNWTKWRPTRGGKKACTECGSSDTHLIELDQRFRSCADCGHSFPSEKHPNIEALRRGNDTTLRVIRRTNLENAE